jgi:hypothetical protein
MGVAALLTVAAIGLVARSRIEDARRFSQPMRVQTHDGTNYVVQLLESTIGKTDSGYVLLLNLRFRNPNLFSVTLRRDWFLLVDHAKEHFQPIITGTQAPLIELPPNGVSDREMLSFTLPEDALAGSVGLQIGQNCWVTIKDEKPFVEPIKRDEFRTFRRRRW